MFLSGMPALRPPLDGDAQADVRIVGAEYGLLAGRAVI